MRADPVFLSIDLGSTHFKASVFDGRLKPLGSGAAVVRHAYGTGGSIEFDVARCREWIQQALGCALKEAGVRVGRVKAIGITSQAQSFTVLDPRGRSRMPFVSWQDTRAAETARMLIGLRALSGFSRHCSFTSPLPGLQLCLIRHLRETRPGILREEDKVVSLPSYLALCLTGEAVIDRNLAAMTGLYSMRTGRWWRAGLEACGLQEGQLPRIHEIGEVCGFTGAGAAWFGIPAGIPVVLAGNDQTSGAYGARVHARGAVLVSLGTAQVAYRTFARMPEPSRVTARGPYPGGLWYGMMVDSCGGSVINWATTVIAGCGTHEDFFALAAKAAPGCGGLSFIPDLPGAEGCWRKLGFHHAVSDMARSVLESIVERMAAMVENLCPGKEKVPLLIAGGGSRQKLWRDLLAKRLEQPLMQVAADPLLGAARMAKAALAGSRR